MGCIEDRAAVEQRARVSGSSFGLANQGGGDGAEDLIAFEYGGRVYSAVSAADGDLQPVIGPVADTDLLDNTYLAAGDFDGDGNADAASGATPPVLFGDGEGGFDLVGYPQEAGPGVGGSFLSAAFGDLDGDGDDELVGSGLGRVLVKVANGRESATTYADGLSPVPTSEFWGFVLAVSDVDDDGAADVVLLSDTPNEADGTRPHEILILSHWSGASSGTIRHVALPDSCTEDEQIMGLHTPDDVDGDGRSDIGFSYWRGCGEPERMTVWLLQRDDPGA